MKKKNKKRQTIKLPSNFKKFIQDPKMQKEFINFAKGRSEAASFKEITSYKTGWNSSINGKVQNVDEISLATYKLMRKDVQLQLGLKVIKYPIKAMKWWAESEDKDRQAFINFALKRVWKSLLNTILNGLDFGYSVSEKIWEVKDVEVKRKDGDKEIIAYKGQAVLLKKLKDPDPITLTIKEDKNGDFDGFVQDKSGEGEVIVDAKKSFVFTNEKEFGNLYGKSLLGYAYQYWYWAIMMYQFLNRYFERRGTPPVFTRAPSGKTEMADGSTMDNLVLARKMGESLAESSVVALPSSVYDEKSNSYKWDLKYLNDDQRADMFIKYIEHLNCMKLRALFVPERTVTQDSEMGARAVASEHINIFLMGLEGLIDSIIDHIEKYIIPQLLLYNFGEGGADVYIKTSGLKSDAKTLLQQILMSVIQKGDGQVPIDMIKALEELNLPIKEITKEDKIKPEEDKIKPEEDKKKKEPEVDEDEKDDDEEKLEAEENNLVLIRKLLEK